MNKTKKALQLLLVLALTVLCFAACGTKTHTVTFHTGGDASITQLVADGKSVSEPKVVLGENEEVVGWYTQENGGVIPPSLSKLPPAGGVIPSAAYVKVTV